MYQNIFIESGEEGSSGTVHLWDDKQGYTTLPLSQFSYAYKPDTNGSKVSMTGIRVSKTKMYKWNDPKFFESDVSRETRVLTDIYLNEELPAKGNVVMFFDIEVSMKNGKPNIENPNNEITAITVYCSVTKTYYVLVLDTSKSRKDYKKDDTEVYFFDNEIDLLYKFMDIYESIGPTIISGWNSDYFDVPYLYNRLRQQCGTSIANKLSPIGKIKYQKYRGKWSIAGVSSLDYMDLYKKFVQGEQPNYRLNTIGLIELNMGKLEYEGTLDEFFDRDLDGFIEYNKRDVEIIVNLDEKKKFIDLAIGVCSRGHVPYENYCFSSSWLEGAIITNLHRKNVVVTNKPVEGKELMAEREENDEEGFSGAYVKPPCSGLYEWIYALDIRSLYPSIIMSLNISPETKIGIVKNWDYKKHSANEIESYQIQEKNSDKVTEVDRDKFIKFMNKMNLNISSNGVLYTTDKMGIIPEILDTWFKERLEYIELRDKANASGDMETSSYYDARQAIQKIFLNSLYGVLGLPSFRFFDLDNALAVTASGQDVIKNSAKYVSGLYVKKNAQPKLETQLMHYKKILDKLTKPRKKDGKTIPPALSKEEAEALLDPQDYCIYIDTDSLYFSSTPILPENADPLQFTIKLAQVMERGLNVYYNTLAKELFFCNNHRIEIKGEGVSNRGIWLAKKRYALNVVWSLEDNCPPKKPLKIKGLDVVRSTFAPAFRDFMKGMLIDILDGKGKKDIDKSILEFREKLNGMPYMEVANNKAAKDISKYEADVDYLNTFAKGTPSHVKAAITFNQLLTHFGIEDKYEMMTDGEKLKYVYLTTNPLRLEAIGFRGSEDPKQIIDIIKEYIDYDALFDRELKKKLGYFYEALEWGLLPTDVNQNCEEFFSF